MAKIIILPTSPEEIAINLTPADLRKLDFSALDFETLRQVAIEYIKTYFPDDFNDFTANNGVIMLVEIMAYIGHILSQRSDILVDASFLPTARTFEAVDRHLELINQRVRRATPATVDVEITIPNLLPVEVIIPAGLQFSATAGDGETLTYEAFRAPGDFSSPISIPPGKRGIIGFGIEGAFGTPIVATSPGGPDQSIDIDASNVLDEPIFIDVTTGEDIVRWRRVSVLETTDPNDEVFEVRHFDERTSVFFGDDITGKAPIAGQVITVSYRIGGGIRGRIGSNIINETRPVSPQPPASAVVDVLFRNPTPSVGGRDEETLDQAKKRAPREFSTQGRAVTGEDYAILAANFSHPVFGSVLKAIGTIRTGIEGDINQVVKDIRAAETEEEAEEILQTNFVNRNIPELIVLAEGADGKPVIPSVGLKKALITFFSDINVLTDEVRVLDGGIKTVDIDMTVVMSRNADASTLKTQVINALDDFFNVENFDIGQGLFLSNLYDLVQSIPGVKFVDIFKPTDDISPIEELSPSESNRIGVNEIIVLGSQNIRFFFEKSNFRR